MGILLIVVAVALGVAGMLLAKRPAFYSSTAAVKVARDDIDLPDLAGMANLGATAVNASRPFFIETEMAVIESDATLDRVVTELNLTEVWGRRHSRRAALPLDETLQLLKQRVQTQPGSGDDVIQIKAFSEVPNEAADLANAVARAYCDYRVDYRRRLAQAALDKVASKHAEMGQQISEQQAKVEQAWQQLDPATQALATTNTANANSEVLRKHNSRLSEALLRYLAASNQLALFPATNPANAEVIEQLKSRLEKTKAELTAAENATATETRRLELLTAYQTARQELEELNQRFAPVQKRVEELQTQLRPPARPPASVVEQATASSLPDPGRDSRQPWMLPSAGVAFLIGLGLLVVGRRPKKATT
ncbi:MAG TPA: hypothetical protein VFZ59_16255 [Verrucomicrobiae bacterium]|nr:hypothetical protein [Verrucomicrobiae bacterium]